MGPSPVSLLSPAPAPKHLEKEMAEGITQLAEAGEKGGRANLQQPRCREKRLEKAGGQWAGLHLPFQKQATAQLCNRLCPCLSHSNQHHQGHIYMERVLVSVLGLVCENINSFTHSSTPLSYLNIHTNVKLAVPPSVPS